MIKAAKNMGFKVISSGNQPMDLGHQFADQFVSCDYSKSDRLLNIAKSHKIDAICPSCNDFSAISCSVVAEKLGLPGHDTPENCLILHHKDKWRKFATENDIDQPKWVTCESLKQLESRCLLLNFPLMVKPVDLTGGKGISLVNNLHEAKDAYKKALTLTKCKKVIIEEFIIGTNHGLSTIIKNEKVAFFFADDETYSHSPFAVTGASYPSSCPKDSIQLIIQDCEKIARLLQLKDGILHIQFLNRSNNKPTIIEICRRPPGDLYVDLVKYATSMPYAESIVQGFCGNEINIPKLKSAEKFVTRHCITSNKIGKFFGYEFDKNIDKKIFSKLLFGTKETNIQTIEIQKFGIVFIDHANLNAFNKERTMLNQSLKVLVS